MELDDRKRHVLIWYTIAAVVRSCAIQSSMAASGARLPTGILLVGHRHGQDTAGVSGDRRGQYPVLLYIGIRIRRNRYRRGARARPVRARPQSGIVHHHLSAAA